MEENPNAGTSKDNEDEILIDYDADGNPIAPEKDKNVDPLSAIDHSLIKYHPFEKNFYEEHPDIATLSNIQVIDLQQKLNVKVEYNRGYLTPPPHPILLLICMSDAQHCPTLV